MRKMWKGRIAGIGDAGLLLGVPILALLSLSAGVFGKSGSASPVAEIAGDGLLRVDRTVGAGAHAGTVAEDTVLLDNWSYTHSGMASPSHRERIERELVKEERQDRRIERELVKEERQDRRIERELGRIEREVPRQDRRFVERFREEIEHERERIERFRERIEMEIERIAEELRRIER